MSDSLQTQSHKTHRIFREFFYFSKMKIFFMIAACLAGAAVNAQFNVSVQSAPSFASAEAILYTLSGSKDVISSRAVKKNNSWTFKVPQAYSGMMKLYFPETNATVNLVSENKNISMKLETTADQITRVIYEDDTNRLMDAVQDKQRKNEVVFQALVQIAEYYRPDSEFGKALVTEIKYLSKDDVIDATKNPFVHYYHTSYNRFLVEQSAKTPPGQKEIADFISNSGGMLETSSLLRPLLVNFLNAGGSAQVDSSVDGLLARLDVESPRGQTVLSELIDLFDVYAMKAQKAKYLSLATNLKCTITDRLAATIKSNKDVEVGAVFPDYQFKSPVNTKARNLHGVQADQKIIVFWSSGCAHCDTELPKILEKYAALKARNIEVIGFALDSDREAYARKSSNYPWINDTELRGWNSSYADTYNVHATPTYFILDAANKIIAKPEHVSDVLQFLNLK